MTEAVGSDEGICALYIDAWVGVVKVISVLVDGGSLIDLIGAGVARDLGLSQYEGAPLNIVLANDLTIAVSTYVWVTVNVVGVGTRMKFYVLNVDQSYTMLLSRRWLKRVKAREDYHEGTLDIMGGDGVR